MKRQGIAPDWIAAAALLLAAALALPAHAQPAGSVNDFQLPPGGEAPPPPAPGPVDPESPVPVQSNPAPAPQPNPAPPPVAPTQVSPRTTAPPLLPYTLADSPPPAPAARAPAQAVKSPRTTPPPPAPADQEPPAVSSAPPPPAAATTPASPAAAPTPSRFPPWSWWLGGGMLLALLLTGIGYALRRRRHADDIDDMEQAEDVPPLVEESPAPTPGTGVSRPPSVSSRVELAFEPERLTMALVNARLAYRLSLTNHGDAPVGPVSIACDIISAHGSLNNYEQLLSESDMGEPKHQFPELSPGESIALTGELQLPIAAILPIRSGGASLFVPLARFRVTALEEGRPSLVSNRIFIIGESPDLPGKRLKPIRIDLGPRTFSHIGQREIKAAA